MNHLSFDNSHLDDIIQLKNISQSYDAGKTWILKDLNFLIEDKPKQGQFVSILGKSGCGKSTLLRYICGLQQPTQGEVLIHSTPRTNNHRVGMVFQRYSCLPWYTVLQNVELGMRYQGIPFKERRKEARRIIELVGLKGHEDKYAEYPMLSGGQLQRVAIAMNLAIKPEILVMDEPFGALDVKTRLNMQDMLNEIWVTLQTTIIFVTHDIAEAVYLSDDVYIMDANPGRFVKHFKIPLPHERNRSLKRDPSFNKTVFAIEDFMMDLERNE
ncbi:MAG: ABC transporter ATP-binding protein [Leptospira sp.]|jgi:NitT/TauT family transport system ATP-binding protein|nr:ABC transporter ATP-binding protein [Leptospira sp.]